MAIETGGAFGRFFRVQERGQTMIRTLRFAAIMAVLALGSPVLAQFSNSYTFLKAVRESDINKAQTSLSATSGSIINAKDPDTGDTALHIATKRTDAPWMRYLMDNGANPQARDGAGETAMTLAAARGHRDGLIVLIAYRADINAQNENGETPLIKAVQARQEQIVRQLLEAGARTDISDNVTGYTALEHAERDKRAVRIIAMLKAAQTKK
jgi:uncharacterized protein